MWTQVRVESVIKCNHDDAEGYRRPHRLRVSVDDVSHETETSAELSLLLGGVLLDLHTDVEYFGVVHTEISNLMKGCGS